MIRLFAGIGSQGEMRFIGEVERGAACGCRCPECDSPLIAKQGNEKEWHFAHESGQERPECHAGEMNMLRRLAIEYLKHREVILLPPYRANVRASSPLGGRSATVEWKVQFRGPLTWLPKGPRSAPVAVGRLDSQIEASLFVDIGEPYRAKSNLDAGMASIDFVFSIPPISDLRIRTQAEQHLRNAGRVHGGITRTHLASLRPRRSASMTKPERTPFVSSRWLKNEPEHENSSNTNFPRSQGSAIKPQHHRRSPQPRLPNNGIPGRRF
jgi:hypothetical protein